jgi:drug/metabolite transporter (DMT)-like permease
MFAWVASIVYGLYSITAKLIGKYTLKNVSQFSFFIMLFSGIVSGTISIINGASMPNNWTYIILAALFLSLGNLLYLSTLKNLDVSVLSPLFNLRVVITVLIGYFLLGERLTSDSFLLVMLIVVAGVFATMDERFSIKSFFTKKIALGLLFMLVLSIQSFFINRAIDQAGYWTATLWMVALAALFSFIFLFKNFYKDVLKSKLSDYSGVLLLSLFGGVGDLAAYKAFQGNVGVSSVIISLPISMLFAFMFSIWKPSLLEKHPVKVYVLRFAMAGIMIWGALNLSK